MFGPILIFDSGIGGLSIFDEIRKVLPDQDCCYLFDNARLPYGELEESVLIEGCVELICEQAQRIAAELVIVACNSASTLVLPSLRSQLSIPVVGVVPAIKPAAKVSQARHIGLLATPGTIKRSYTLELIEQFADGCKVELFGSSELVMLAEAKLAGDKLDLKLLESQLRPIKESQLDTLVLGCTHFPILAQEMQQVLGHGVKLLDSGVAIAQRVAYLLNEISLERGQNRGDVRADKNKEKSLTAIYTTEDISAGLTTRLAEKGFTTIVSRSSANLG
ncbi:glutamate racemase [Shewanella schlegeliana]|uniref:Glutamate racemase n=1 Tax=Shewanella schlegeliana TaxID=190308 RepID=A0ABS1T3D8_9GAMM|nr:glutamate racemase [Shewanella schlegeliana]MBL4915311.1 glutamate racemase [Shewanella schlegeliana]MCL1111178.1 glutamate racemase [Shewanella schlegeliana]GIU34310.1 glutamate racemase [Shewanella schlegeliana]